MFNRHWDGESLEAHQLKDTQFRYAVLHRTSGKPADAGPSHVVCELTGMVCDCNAPDADDCCAGLACRMWRDFSVVSSGEVDGDDEHSIDPWRE